MSTIVTWEPTGARPARAEPTRTALSLVRLLGADAALGAGDGGAALGDVLAFVGQALGLEPSAPVCAAAEVRDERVSPADGLGLSGAPASLAMLVDAEPERRLVLADAATHEDSSAEQVRRVLGSAPASRVLGVLTLGEAFDRVFAVKEQAFAGTLIPPERRARAQEALFAAALSSSRLPLEWHLVADLAIGLLGHAAADDSRAQLELGFVRDVARRHDGVSAPMMWPDDEELAPYAQEQQREIVAHVVQSVADGEWAAVPEYARKARAIVGDDRSPAAFKVLGATGRALAAIGDYEAAAEVLRAAVDGWLAIGSPAGASYPLCELIRVEGVRGDPPMIHALLAHADASVGRHLDASSKPYLTLAIGRALAQVGAAREALLLLEREELGVYAPRHVQAGALRWRAVAARALGESALAKRAQESLEALGDTDQRILARLDTGPLTVEQTRAALDELLALPGDGDEARRMLNRLAPGLSTRAIAERPEVIRRLRVEYRY